MPEQAKRYLVAPNMAYVNRALVVAGFFVVGVALQVFVQPIIGVVPVCAGGLFLFARNVSNKPVVGRKRKWESVTMAEFDRAKELCRGTAKWGRDAFSISSGWGFLTLAVIGVSVWLAGRYLADHEGTAWAVAWYVDAAAVLIPLWFSGMRSGWVPAHLNIKLDALENIRVFFEMTRDPKVKLEPMLEVATNAKGENVPMDARFMVRFSNGPDDFIGVQVQVSLNDVQGTKYPYLYCVILAKQGFGLTRRIAAGRVAKGDIIEAQVEKEVEVVVVRQYTTKKSGYHTNPAAQRRVYSSAMGLAALVVHGAADEVAAQAASAGAAEAGQSSSPRAPRRRRTKWR